MSNTQYEVEVTFSNKRILKVWASDEAAAEEKATNMVEAWPNVVEVLETTCTGEAS